MAIAVDLYDLSGCLGLRAKSWCSAIARYVDLATDVETLVRLGWIAWVFGDAVLFQDVLDRLVEEVQSDENGALVGDGGLELGNMEYVKAMDLLGE